MKAYTYSPEEQQFIDQTLANPKVQTWMAQFGADSVKPFLRDYFRNLGQWNRTGEHYLSQKHDRLTRITRRAEDLLEFVQQKKLWDLQILWRANQATVEGVVTSLDFLLLEGKIKSLDFISPISGADIELLKAFLEDDHASRNILAHDGWQDYGSLIRKNEIHHLYRFPKFYEFADAATGTVPLWRVLPDLRGEKESYYAGVARRQRYEATAPTAVPDREIDFRPSLYIGAEHAIPLAKMIEEHKTYERIEAYYTVPKDKDYQLAWAIEILEEADLKLPIEAHPYWKTGVILAAQRYDHGLLVEALDAAYENYLFRRQVGIGFADEPFQTMNFKCDPMHWRNEILKGREILGEPLDFNF